MVADIGSSRVPQGQGLGRFEDISELTMFADYRVPVVLRQMGILVYSAQLANMVGPQKSPPLKSGGMAGSSEADRSSCHRCGHNHDTHTLWTPAELLICTYTMNCEAAMQSSPRAQTDGCFARGHFIGSMSCNAHLKLVI